MDTVAVALLISIAYSLINFFKYLSGRNWNGAATLASVWVAGAVVAMLGAQSDLGDVSVDSFLGTTDVTLASLSLAGQIIFGFAVGSAASVGNGLLGAIDSNRDTTKPALFLTGDED